MHEFHDLVVQLLVDAKHIVKRVFVSFTWLDGVAFSPTGDADLGSHDPTV
jgi:hypothetical protein